MIFRSVYAEVSVFLPCGRLYSGSGTDSVAASEPCAFTTQYKKAYFNLVKGTTLSLTKDQTTAWSGGYIFAEPITAGPNVSPPFIRSAYASSINQWAPKTARHDVFGRTATKTPSGFLIAVSQNPSNQSSGPVKLLRMK